MAAAVHETVAISMRRYPSIDLRPVNLQLRNFTDGTRGNDAEPGGASPAGRRISVSTGKNVRAAPNPNARPEPAAGLDGWQMDRSLGRSSVNSRRRRLAGKDDPRFHRHAPVQILNVVIHQPDASGRDQMADGLG